MLGCGAPIKGNINMTYREFLREVNIKSINAMLARLTDKQVDDVFIQVALIKMANDQEMVKELEACNII